MDSKYLPTDKEIKDFFYHHISGNISCYSDIDYDLEDIVKEIKGLISVYVDKALSSVKNEQQVFDTSTDLHSDQEQKKSVERLPSSGNCNDIETHQRNDEDVRG